MSSCGEYILTTKGEAISYSVLFKQKNGSPLNLTGASLLIPEASHAVLKEAGLSLIDAEAGSVVIDYSDTQAEQFPDGLRSWFRIEADLPGAPNVVTPKIWILVK